MNIMNDWSSFICTIHFTATDSTIAFNRDHLHVPSTKDEIIQIVKLAASNNQKIKVIGSGHSWSQVATSDNILVSLHHFTGLVSVDESNKQVTVKAGTTFTELNEILSERGLAMKNLGSISDQTVAGGISTGVCNSNNYYRDEKWNLQDI